MKFIILATSLIEIGLAVHYLRLFFRYLPQTLLAHLLLLVGILFYCAGGTFLAYATLSANELSDLLLWRRIGDEHIFAALVITFLFCVFLHWLAMRFIQYVGIPSDSMVSALDRVALNPLAFGAVSVVILGAYAALAATGRVTFHGTETTQQSEAAASDPFLMVMFQVLFLMPILCGYRLFEKGKLFPTLVTLMASMGFALYQGRRNLILFLFFVVIGYALNRRIQVTRFVKGVVIASVVALGILGFVFSMAMRMANWYSGGSATGAQGASFAYQMLVNGGEDKSTNVASMTKDNVSVRSFNPILFIASLTSADRSRIGALGEVMVNGAAFAVPGPLWHQKQFYTRSEEEIASATMHIPVSEDEAETIMSGAYNDFREPGIVIYGLFVVLMLMVCVFLLRRTSLPVLQLLSLSAVLLIVLNTEAEVDSWFLLFRSLLTIFLANEFCRLFYPRTRVIQVPRRAALEFASAYPEEKMTPR